MTYDELGRQTRVVEAAGTAAESETRYGYDALDRQTSYEPGWQADGSHQKTVTGYDLGGRATTVDDEFACTRTTYDHRDLPTTIEEGLAGGTCTGTPLRTLQLSHDALGRLTQRTVTSGTGVGDVLESVAYDSAGGRRSSYSIIAELERSTSSTINPLGEVVYEVQSMDAQADLATSRSATNYDAAGNPTDRCFWTPWTPETECVRADQGSGYSTASSTLYDARNNRIALYTPDVGETTYDPDAGYQVKATFVPTAAGREHQTIRTYDERERLDTITEYLCTSGQRPVCSGSNIVWSRTADDYAYDGNHNRTLVVEANGATTTTRSYCYDAHNQLTAVWSAAGCTGSQLESYTYDAAGNRLTAPGQTFSYDTTTRRLTGCTSGCGTISYDAAGRITALDGWTFGYDGDGRLASAATSAAGTISWTYDGDGRRTTETVTPAGGSASTREFRYDGAAIAEELLDGVPERRYRTDESGRVVKLELLTGTDAGTYLVTWNGHGDALALWQINPTTGDLTLANSYTYSTWGTPTTGVHNGIGDLGFRFLYVGAHDVQWDNALGLGLAYMHARTYSPTLGRFLQPDPAAAEANLYGYAKNNPATETDPTGACPWCIAIIVVRALSIGVPIIAAAAQRFAPALATSTQRTVPVVSRFWSTANVAARTVPLLRYSSATFRENLSRLTGVRPGLVAQAHHVFPQKFAVQFQRLGINIHDPRYGAWWPSSSHAREAFFYNRAWELFLQTRPTTREALAFGRALSRAFGLKSYY